MGRYLLDTHAFLYAQFEPERLQQETLNAIESRGNAVFVSLASVWEFGIKSANGKLPQYARLISAGAEGIREALKVSEIALLSIELEHALAAARLPQHHRDPFDRIMIAQAQLEGLTLISNDQVFAQYAGLSLVQA